MMHGLAGLPHLQHLFLEDIPLLPSDALALTMLTGLTRLNVQGAGRVWMNNRSRRLQAA
jgi:hypothetical protein